MPYVVLAGMFVFAFHSALIQMVLSWSTNEEYSHGFLVPLISGYIMYTRRKEVIVGCPGGRYVGLGLASLATGIFAAASYAEMLTAMYVAILLFIWGAFLFLLGFRGCRPILFPLVFLVFTIPVPAQIYTRLTVPLQLFVSQAVEILGVYLGLPVLVEGNVITLPARTLRVVEACSGLRSMVSLMSLSAVFGHFVFEKVWKIVVLFAASIPLAIIVNIIRVLAIVVCLQFLHLDLTVGFPHLLSGAGVFLLSIGLLFWASSLLHRCKDR